MVRKTKGGKTHDDEENHTLSFMNIILMIVVFSLGIAVGNVVLPMLLNTTDTSNSMMDTVKSLTKSITANTAPVSKSTNLPAPTPAPAPAPLPTATPLIGGKKAFKNKYR